MQLADLHRAVQAALVSKRLGTPVFVRYLYHRPDDKQPSATLAKTVAQVQGWIGQPLQRLVAVGTAEHRHISLSLEFQKGATALVAWTGAPGREGVDLMLVGNHGAVYHDAGTALLWDDGLADDKRDVDAHLVDLINRALKSNRPETAGGKP